PRSARPGGHVRVPIFRLSSVRRGPVNTLPTEEDCKSGPFPRHLDPARQWQTGIRNRLDTTTPTRTLAATRLRGKSPGSGEAVSPRCPRSSWRCECLASLDAHEVDRKRGGCGGGRPAREDAPALGAARRARDARHEIRLRSRLLRSLHRAARWKEHEIVPDRG